MSRFDDDFASRWSRRKREARVVARDRAAKSETDRRSETGQKDVPSAPVQESAPDAFDPESLPDPDTLGADADYTVFLRSEVPEALRRRALRRLWRSNPVLANLDGLNDYDEDYTDAATVVSGMKTLYQVGRGFVVEDDAPAAEAEAADTAESAADEAEPGAEADTAGDNSAELPAPTSEAADAMPARAKAPQVAAAPKVRRRAALERRWGGKPGDGKSDSA